MIAWIKFGVLKQRFPKCALQYTKAWLGVPRILYIRSKVPVSKKNEWHTEKSERRQKNKSKSIMSRLFERIPMKNNDVTKYLYLEKKNQLKC